MILVLLAILSFAISFANLSRWWVFSFVASMCLKSTFASFRGKLLKNPVCPWAKHILSLLILILHVFFQRTLFRRNYHRGNTLDWHDWHCIWWPVATVVVGDRWPVGLWLVVAGWFLQSALRKIRSKNPLINFSLNKFLGGCAIPASQGFRGSFAKLLQIFGLYRNVWIILLHGSRYIWGSYYMHIICYYMLLSKHMLTILTRILILKISFASFRGSKSSHKFWQIFCKRGFSFRGANLQCFNRPSNHTNHHVRTEGFWRLLGPGICRWSTATMTHAMRGWYSRVQHGATGSTARNWCLEANTFAAAAALVASGHQLEHNSLATV